MSSTPKFDLTFNTEAERGIALSELNTQLELRIRDYARLYSAIEAPSANTVAPGMIIGTTPGGQPIPATADDSANEANLKAAKDAVDTLQAAIKHVTELKIPEESSSKS